MSTPTYLPTAVIPDLRLSNDSRWRRARIVTHIWHSDWQIPNILFILNRNPVIANGVLQCSYPIRYDTMMMSATNSSGYEILLPAIISMSNLNIFVDIAPAILFLNGLSVYRISHTVYSNIGSLTGFCAIGAVVIVNI
ncbi:hypothetical protein SISSUDRAFT_1032041 [Sistotremastrum suecicum HHB10207 ss-3]|uniref:Uncharacterized protein n=1 Tax=Sistotremastrum suecicum HHB10207 ss-3 TaxID=1314776 RepID=A0A166F7F1_9AGAM|nr:hypothetical protein SISSUDRAFT_1032041 [Sistotremastrum suecicum HHB10207 ss-3]